MTPQTLETLMFSGINPPREGSRRTTCPHCSHTRKKTWERCLLVREAAPGIAEVYCHHCKWEDELQ